MKKPLKIAIVFIAVIVLLLLIPVGIFLVIDLNDHKHEIEQWVEGATGRQLMLSGEVNKSIFPWLGVEVGAMSFSNAPGFEDKEFARVQKIQIKVALLPLLKQQIRINDIVLHGLTVNLAVNKEGVSNWDDLAGSSTESVEATAEPPSVPTTESAETTSNLVAGLVVGGIDIRDANIRWDDQQNNTSVEVDHIDLVTSEIKLGQPFHAALSLMAKSNLAKIGAQLQWQGDMQADPDFQRFKIGQMVLRLQADGDDVPTKSIDLEIRSNIDIDLEQQQADITALSLESKGLQLSGHLNGQQITTTPTYHGQLALAAMNPRELMKQLGMNVPETSDPNVLSQASMNFDLGGDLTNLKLDKLAIALDETNINGQVSVSNFEQAAIGYQINVDSIDLDRYLPPVQPAANTSAPAVSEPPTKANDSAMVIELPTEMIRALNVDGNVTIGQAIINKLTVDNIELGTKAENGVVKLSPVKATIAKGAVDVVAMMDVRQKQPKYAANIKMKDIYIGPFAQAVLDDEVVKGMTNLSLDLNSYGQDVDGLLQQLGGKLAVKIINGEAKYLDLADILVEKYAKYLRKVAPKDKPAQATFFKTLSGTATIQKGVVKNNDLSLVSSRFDVSGKGIVNLPKQLVDYRLGVMIVNPTEGMKKIKLDKLTGKTINVDVKGPFDAIEYKVDYQSLYKQKAKQAIEKKKTKVKQQVDEKKDKTKEQVKEKKQELKDKLKDKFKKLF